MAEQSQINKLDRILKQNIEDMEKATEANLISVPPRAGAETGNGSAPAGQPPETGTPSPSAGTDNTGTGGNDTGDSSSNNQDAPAQPENGRDTPEPRRPERIPDGISRAYDDVSLGEFDTKAPKEKTETKGSKPKGGITPPKRDRGGTKGKSGGDDIMEVFWNDCIMAFYAWTIDTVVDNTLDFAEWVLFSPYKSGGSTVETTTEKKPKTIYMLGEELYKSRMESLAKEKEKLIELNENLEKSANGIQPEWKLWGKMPSFFPKLQQIHAKAVENPDSEEAKFIQKYGLGSSAETVKGRFSKEEKLFMLAVRLATVEEVVSDAKNTISPEFSQKLAALDEALKKNDCSKHDITEKIDALALEIGGESAVCKDVSSKIQEVKALLEKDGDISKVKKDIVKKVKEIHKFAEDVGHDEDIIKEHIRKRSQEKYKKLMENIDKIHETYADEPEKVTETIKKYLSSVNNAGKDAKQATDKVIEEGLIGKINSGEKRKKAKVAVKKIDEAIDNFMLKGEKISSKDPADQKDEFVLTEKQFSKAIETYRLGR